MAAGLLVFLWRKAVNVFIHYDALKLYCLDIQWLRTYIRSCARVWKLFRIAFSRCAIAARSISQLGRNHCIITRSIAQLGAKTNYIQKYVTCCHRTTRQLRTHPAVFNYARTYSGRHTATRQHSTHKRSQPRNSQVRRPLPP